MEKTILVLNYVNCMAEIAEQISDNKSHLSHKNYYISYLCHILLSTKDDTTNEKPTYNGIENGAATPHLNLRYVHLGLPSVLLHWSFFIET